MTQGISEQHYDITHGGFQPLLPGSVFFSLKGFSFEQGFHEPQGELTRSAKPRMQLGSVRVVTTAYAASEPAEAHVSPREFLHVIFWSVRPQNHT